MIFLPLVKQRPSTDTHSFHIFLQKSASPLSLFFSTNKNSQLFPLHPSCFCLMSLLANNTKAEFFFLSWLGGPLWDIYFEKYYKLIYLRTKSERIFFPSLLMPVCGACCSLNISALLVSPGLVLQWLFPVYGTWLFMSPSLSFPPSPLHPFPLIPPFPLLCIALWFPFALLPLVPEGPVPLLSSASDHLTWRLTM